MPEVTFQLDHSSLSFMNDMLFNLLFMLNDLFYVMENVHSQITSLL